MKLTLQGDLENYITEIKELILKLEELEKKIEFIKFLNIKEFAKVANWSEKKASELYRRPDFPSCDFGKEKIAEVNAIIKYFSVPRRK